LTALLCSALKADEQMGELPFTFLSFIS
jgi:hypothetical protein